MGFTLFYEENYNGGILIWWFFGFWAGGHVVVGRRGGPLVCLGELLGAPCVNGWT
jgi:hypothetical protein